MDERETKSFNIYWGKKKHLNKENSQKKDHD